MFCPHCGKQLPDDSVFCDACGARLDGQPAPAPEQGFGQPQNFAPEQNFDQPQNFEPAESYAPAQKFGSKVPLIAGIAVLALALAGGAIFFLGKGKKGQETAAEETDVQTEAAAAEEEPEEAAAADTFAEEEKEEAPADVIAETEPEPAAEEALPEEEPEEETAEEPEETTAESFAGEDYAAAAGRLSTDDYAMATDFEWFLAILSKDGTGQDVTDASQSTRITGDMQPLINGGWKAFICTEEGVYGSDVERYFNAGIDSEGEDFQITLNLKYLFDPNVGSSVEENEVLVYDGTFDAAAGTAECPADDSRITFDGFYISNDGKREYATGTYEWISGERDRIALMRSVGN